MIEINLLPRELRTSGPGLHLPKVAVVGLVAGAFVLAGLGAVTFWQMNRLGKAEAQVQRAQQRVESMKDDIALVDRLTGVKQSISQRLEAIEALDRNRGEWTQNLEDVAAVIPDYLWLSSFRRNDYNKALKPAPGAAPTDSTPQVNNDYLFSGYCYSLSSLANLILNMQDSPRFKDVALKNANFTDVKDHKVYNFTVYCLLEPYDAKAKGNGDQPANPADLSAMPAEEPAPLSARDEATENRAQAH
jgi:Tfp pilus assembly protein PilN